MKNYFKNVAKVFVVMMLIAVIATGNTVSAKSKYDTYKSNLIIMKCNYELVGTIIEGSIESKPGCCYLYVYPTGKYKSGTKTFPIWPSTGATSAVNIRGASTHAIVRKAVIFDGKCQYRYGKNSKSYTANVIYMDR